MTMTTMTRGDELTVTDLFCGAGGSSLGAEMVPGVKLTMAANHWQVAIDVHQAHFVDAGHDVADISQADPRRYPRTDILIASPECTNHSQAKGISRKKQDPTLWDMPDPQAVRSRATMWDVFRFAEQQFYDVIVVENVVEATKWVGWRGWLTAMSDIVDADRNPLYEHRVISTNSMHHGVPQSRDRIYVVFWRRGLPMNLDLETVTFCAECQTERAAVQSWKNGRTVGRYRQQWVWVCTTCGKHVEPATVGARTIIDWSLPCPRIGDRAKPLVENTRFRVGAGLVRHGWVPITTTGAGNGHERTPGNRARPVTEPLPVQSTTATAALAVPDDAYLVRRFTARGDGGQMTTHVDEPARTLTNNGSPSLLVPDPFIVQTAHGSPDEYVMGGGRVHDLEEPHPTVCVKDRASLVIPMRKNGHSYTPDNPLGTVAAGGNHHGLLMRNNTATGGEMVTSVDEPARTLIAKQAQSLLIPYNANSQARHVDEPMFTATTRDRAALITADEIRAGLIDDIIDACGFRMLEPHEVAAAMAFPLGYIPRNLPKSHQVKLAGNAVTPPVMQWIIGRARQALLAG